MQFHFMPRVNRGSRRLVGVRWWHSPAHLIFYFVFPALLLLSFTAPGIIENAPVLASHRVYITPTYIFQAIGLLFILGLSSLVFDKVPSNRKFTIKNGALDFLFWSTVLAYLIWFGPMVVTRPDIVIGILAGSSGAVYESRDFAQHIPGVTSVSQFGIAYTIIYSTKVYQDLEILPQRYKRMMYAIFSLAVFRAIVASERIGLIEIAVPYFVVFASSYKPRASLQNGAIKFFPYVLYTIAPLFFAIFEYPRSWINYYVKIYDNFFHFIVDRFSLYYATSLNNICLAMTVLPSPNFRGDWTLTWLYRLPFIGNLIAPEGEEYRAGNWPKGFLEYYGDAQYNNPTGILIAVYDWGVFFAPIVMIIYGACLGVSFASFKKGVGWARYVYPVFLYSVFELLRVGYIFDARAFSAILGVVIALVFWRRSKPIPAERHFP